MDVHNTHTTEAIPQARRTAMFYIWESDDSRSWPRDSRLFIGTADEAFEELQEEIRTLYPEDFARIDARTWRRHRAELLYYVGRRTRVWIRDDDEGDFYVAMEMSGGWRDE